MTSIRKNYAVFGAMLTVSALSSTGAFAAGAGAGAGAGAAAPTLVPMVGTTSYTDRSFSTIFERITTSFGGLPGLISMFAYLIGIVFAIAGILKIKDHVENPQNTDLKAGAIRLIVGGALFALPYIMEVMTASIGEQQGTVGANVLNKAEFGVH